MVVVSLGALGREFWSDSLPISGSVPGLIVGSEPRLASLDIAFSQKPLLLPGVYQWIYPSLPPDASGLCLGGSLSFP